MGFSHSNSLMRGYLIFNLSHLLINLINEVISEAQPMIQKYLRKELGL